MAKKFLGLAAVLAVVAAPISAQAVTTTVGPGGFDNGFATAITYDDAAPRGTANDRDNPLNALGASDGKFFELGWGGWVDLTFGTQFDTSVSIFEITFGNLSSWQESVLLYVGLAGGSYTYIGTISNADAQGGVTIGLPAGLFDTVRLGDASPQTSSPTGGFDLDAVRITPVPLPASGLLLVGVLGATALLKRRRKA